MEQAAILVVLDVYYIFINQNLYSCTEHIVAVNLNEINQVKTLKRGLTIIQQNFQCVSQTNLA